MRKANILDSRNFPCPREVRDVAKIAYAALVKSEDCEGIPSFVGKRDWYCGVRVTNESKQRIARVAER
jgi:hypothetical protein